jgi:predicted metalloprotease
MIGLGGGRLGLGGLLVMVVLSLVFGRDFLSLFLGVGTGPGLTGSSGPITDEAEEPMVEFVSFVLDDAQQTWEGVFANQGDSYQRARLVLFRDAVDSACGFAQSAMGPFYCPGDQKVYIDLSFYEELKRRFGAPGDFAQAYVLAHEIGHHVQNLLGVERQVRSAQQQDPSSQNELSVRMELQADCFAGVWAHSTNQRGLLESGDVEEAMGAASAVGDDTIQKKAQGRVVPESFTHGSAEQRMTWFRRGLESGDPASCNTFAN